MNVPSTIFHEHFIYRGGTKYGEPNGFGTFNFISGHIYTGDIFLGHLHGFGVYSYAHDTPRYMGFFSYDKFHGVGTYENMYHICKGHWKNGTKHGYFKQVDKVTGTTYNQLWVNDILFESEIINPIDPMTLLTHKAKPQRAVKPAKTSGSTAAKVSDEKKCIACAEIPVNSTIANCGHVCMCYGCLAKCDKCPICRGPVDKIVKLYVS